MTSDNLEVQTYPYHIDPLHPGSIQIENFIPETFCLGFISTVAFGPVGHSPVGHFIKCFKSQINCTTMVIHIFLDSLRYRKKNKAEKLLWKYIKEIALLDNQVYGKKALQNDVL